MFVRPTISPKKIIKKTLLPAVIVVLYATLIFRMYDYRGIDALDIPMSISTVLGFAVSLLLGFRTSEAYDRWWEARKIWGAVVNDSRSLARQLIGFLDEKTHGKDIQEISYMIIAWNHALKNAMRDKDTLDEIRPVLSEADLKMVTDHQNIPNALLLLIELRIKKLKQEEAISLFEFVKLDATVQLLCDHMGKSERINNTVFPAHYRLFTRVGIFLYTLMLPFGMLKSTDMFMIPIVTVVFLFFSTLERIAFILQDPFKNRGSDTPMSSICRTIEINIRQMLGESDLPPKLEPDEFGVLR